MAALSGETFGAALGASANGILFGKVWQSLQTSFGRVCAVWQLVQLMVAEMRVVRIDLRARLPDVLIGPVAGLALRVERTLVVGDGTPPSRRSCRGTRPPAAHLRVKVRERLARRRFAADEGAAQKRADHQAECLLRQHDVFSF